MTATPLPDSDQTIPSLPRSLYLGAHDQPHWSKISDAPDGRRKADGVRSVESTRRQRQLAQIHDSLHHLRASATAIGTFDRNGMTLAAADNLELSLEHTASSIAILVADMRVAAAAYTEAELRASTPPPPPPLTQDEDAALRDAEDLAEREAEDLEADMDARATDQVITALAARTAVVEVSSIPTPADIVKAARAPMFRPDLWPQP